MALSETTDALAIPRPADDGSDPFDTTDYRTAVNLIDAFVGDKGADLASAATLTLPTTMDGHYFDVTGTTTITAISSKAAGIMIVLQFDAALTLTHNATTLMMPGGYSRTTVAGDRALFISEGGGNWRCLAYTTIQARHEWREGANIASAATLAVGTDGNYFHVTGTTTITALSGMIAGTWFKLEFDGALTFTHHATNLDLPGDANITTVAGDVAFMYAKTATTAKCVGYFKANGQAVAGGGYTPIYVSTGGLSILTGNSGGRTFTANDALYMPIEVPGNMTVTKVGLYINTSSGNLDVGIYNSAGTRLVSSGATASPGTGVRWIAIGSTGLTAGQHWLGIAVDNNTIALGIHTSATVLGSDMVKVVATNYPLPASFTPPTVPSGSTGYSPVIAAVA